MRSFILVSVTAFVLALGALVYFWLQPTRGRRVKGGPDTTSAPLVKRANPTDEKFADGEDVGVKKYDQRTGELSYEFRADTYSPQKGGNVAVTNAVGRFYLANGQVLQIHGRTGVFKSDNSTSSAGKKKPTLSDNRGGAPSRGELHAVTITMIQRGEDDDDEWPTMFITMNNASFDSESCTIYTEAYKDRETGKVVAADQVKVEIRSPEDNAEGYDFDGRGLRIAWNERDHRLSKLDVAHGERLVIRNPKGFTQAKNADDTAPKPKKAAPPVAAATVQPSAPVKPAAERVTLAADVIPPAAAAAAPTTAPSPRRRAGAARSGKTAKSAAPMPKFVPSSEPPIYRATFTDNVRIVQNEVTLATSERMLVDFWMKTGGGGGGSDGEGATSQPTTGPATRPAARSARAPRRPSTTQTAASRPTTHPALAATREGGETPATKPADQMPVYVYWSGPLHVEPYAEASVKASESIVTLEGTPVVARQQNSEIKASRLIYRTEDGSLRGASLPGTDVTMTTTDARGDSLIHTAALEYLSHAQPPMAILTGKSTADLPAQADGAKMHAAWTDRCTLRFDTSPDGRSAIKDADLTGNVAIDHPQVKLNAQRLELAFAAPPVKAATSRAVAATTQSGPSMQTNLKQLVASNAVHCILTDAQQKSQTIDCDRLTLLTDATADGRLVPRTVNADGRVHAVDADQDLRAGHLAVTLAPTTRPAKAATRPTTGPQLASSRPARGTDGGFAEGVDLQSLIAHDQVHVIGLKDGTEAFADTMLIDKKNGRTNVKLVGQPSATVIDKGSVVTGPVIDLSPDDQQMNVDGAGTLHGIQQEGTATAGAGVGGGGNATTKPIDVAWSRSLRVDGKQNVVYAVGEVVGKTQDADGTVNTIRGDRAQLLLVNVPAPATKPATTATATQASTKPARDQNRKLVRQALFNDNASVSSNLLDNEGLPLRRMNVLASTIQYDVLDPLNIAAPHKRITIPVGGRMLVEDYRPPSTQPADKKPDDGGMGSARGATAFQWTKSLIYDDETHNAVMSGGVIIDHRDDVQKEDSMRLTGETVTAELEPLPPAPASSRPASNEPRYQVKRVTANGGLLVTMKGGELNADSIVYSPITRILTARGNDRADAIFTRTTGGGGAGQPIRAQELQWDANTDLPRIVKSAGTFRK